MPCLSCTSHSFNGAFLLFFSVLDNGNRTTAFVRVWLIAETIYDWCCMLPAEFGYFAKAVISWPHFFQRLSHKKPKQKNQLCYCFRCCERAHKKWAAAAPEPCWWALSWALGMCCARDDSSSCTHQVLCVLLIHHKTDKIWWLRKMWANKTG